MLYFTVKRKTETLFYLLHTDFIRFKDGRHYSKSCVGSQHRIYGPYGMSKCQNISQETIKKERQQEKKENEN